VPLLRRRIALLTLLLAPSLYRRLLALRELLFFLVAMIISRLGLTRNLCEARPAIQ
jgi:hypothetical protein